MAKAKKLASGQWRTLVYSHTDADKKRHYESFTAETKPESEYLASEFAVNKKKHATPSNFTVKEAIEAYIASEEPLLSPTTVDMYKDTIKRAFTPIMDIKIKKLNNNIMQQAINTEMLRHSGSNPKKLISPKTVKNEYGLITAAINKYAPGTQFNIKLPQLIPKTKELLSPKVIYDMVYDTEMELPVLLAMWLSFSMSEIRGLTKNSISLDGNYITIKEVVVDINGKPFRKILAKNIDRNRKHKLPERIKKLIAEVETDSLVTLSGNALRKRFKKLLKNNNLPDMTFHDLRHVSASVMAMLNIPDKYAQERGGWKTDYVMKSVYMHTFSEERQNVDNKIDTYFEGIMQHEMQHKKIEPL